MTIRPVILALLRTTLTVAMGGAAIAGAQQMVAPHRAPLVFDGVTVIDVQQGRRLLAQRVVIVGQRIAAMGRAGTVSVPAGARIVDARGKYLIPGLWDMHTHAMHSTDLFYPLFLVNGVTGIRDAGSDVPLDTLRLWRQEILAGTRVGPPRLLFSGHSIGGPDPTCDRHAMIAMYAASHNSPQICVANVADARHLVDSLQAAGADMIKPRSVTREIYFAVAAEARRIGIPFGGHAEQETAEEASDSGARIIDHLQFILQGRGIYGICWTGRPSADAGRCRHLADHLRHHGTWVVPTLVSYAAPLAVRAHDPGLGFIAARLAAYAHAFRAGQHLRGTWLRDSGPGNNNISGEAHEHASVDTSGHLRVMGQADFPILAGTDVSTQAVDPSDLIPGSSLHAELALYVTEGFTPLQALQSATLNPATVLHATDSLGTVAPGKLADLVLLDADPLVDITHITAIRAVVANGRYFDRTALDRLLTAAQAKANKNVSSPIP